MYSEISFVEKNATKECRNLSKIEKIARFFSIVLSVYKYTHTHTYTLYVKVIEKILVPFDKP